LTHTESDPKLQTDCGLTRSRRGDLRNILARVEIQSALEGLAARWAAERGISATQLESAHDCLAAIDELIEAPELSADSLAQFLALNARFHGLVVEAVQCRTLNQHAEDAPPNILALPRVSQVLASDPAKLRTVLIIEQDQHHRILEAIQTGMGARAESLVREHSLLSKRHLLEVASA
jgi:GntR family transcriptional regulator, vanillate catabolism transcriptional regulator